MSETRRLLDICREIRQTWVNKDGVGSVNYAAKPYLEAMEECGRWGLENPLDPYYAEDVKTQVIYFLSNATSFRGPDAKRIKAELKLKFGVK